MSNVVKPEDSLSGKYERGLVECGFEPKIINDQSSCIQRLPWILPPTYERRLLKRLHERQTFSIGRYVSILWQTLNFEKRRREIIVICLSTR
jgi:hypothetical protein